MLRFIPELPIQRHWSAHSLLAFLSVFLTGCANTCFVAVSSPPNGTIGIVASNPPPACTLAKPTGAGAVRVVAHVNRLCEFCSETNRIQSVLLSLRGIDIHLKANAEDESSDWQELRPQFEMQPLQVDLLNESTNGRPAGTIAEGVLIPGTYDLVRFRIAPNQPGGDEFPAKNACGRVGSNCVVMADGQVEPLVFEADAMESRFAPEATADGLFFVLPGNDNELLIELTPIVSIGASFGQGVRFFSLLPSRTRVQREFLPG